MGAPRPIGRSLTRDDGISPRAPLPSLSCGHGRSRCATPVRRPSRLGRCKGSGGCRAACCGCPGRCVGPGGECLMATRCTASLRFGDPRFGHYARPATALLALAAILGGCAHEENKGTVSEPRVPAEIVKARPAAEAAAEKALAATGGGGAAATAGAP